MNTEQRHQALRKVRSRILRRRAILMTGTTLFAAAAWQMFSTYGPATLAPPPPETVGKSVVMELSSGTARAVNDVFSEALPRRREKKKAVFASLVQHSFELPETIQTPQAVATTDSVAVHPRVSAPASRRQASETVETLLIGIDSRLGKGNGRADALHLFSIDLETPRITITSIPRGTPVTLGYEDPSRNIISNVRSARGRDVLIRKVAGLCGKSTIPYYVEVGFSQAVGILELLGYDDPMQELQALRMRRGFQYGDHDRAYNQGQFLRRAIPMILQRAEGLTGELLLIAGLRLVETNLTKDVCQGLIYSLNDAGFSRSTRGIEVHVYGKFSSRFEHRAIVDVEDHTVGRVRYDQFEPMGQARAETVLRTALAQAERQKEDARAVKKTLQRVFQQRSWLQIHDYPIRYVLRDSIAMYLQHAAETLKDTRLQAEIRSIINADNILFRSVNRHPD